MICLVGCGIMYLEMAAIFPILDTKSCVATKVPNILYIFGNFKSFLIILTF